jgi:hypothetical protein
MIDGKLYHKSTRSSMSLTHKVFASTTIQWSCMLDDDYMSEEDLEPPKSISLVDYQSEIVRPKPGEVVTGFMIAPFYDTGDNPVVAYLRTIADPEPTPPFVRSGSNLLCQTPE